MSVKRRPAKFLPGLLLGVCGLVLAADDELPGGELLEYLGSWEESDDEWLMFDSENEQVADEQVANDTDERIDPAPKGEESAENDDER